MILETQRLILRQLTVKDTDALLPVLGDAEAMVYYPHPFSRDEVGQFISKQITRYVETGHGLWAMLLKTTGELIGDCGLVPVEELEQPADRQHHGVVDHEGRDQEGQGLGEEQAVGEGGLADEEHQLAEVRCPAYQGQQRVLPRSFTSRSRVR